MARSGHFPLQCTDNKGFNGGLYTTELQAIKYAIFKWSESIKWYESEIATLSNINEAEDYEEDLHFLKKEMTLLKGRLTKIRKRKIEKSRTKPFNQPETKI